VKNKVIETFLWMFFMIAAAVHVMTIINYQGTRLELAITVTVSVAIFNCGVLCGYKLAVGDRENGAVVVEEVFEEVPVSNGRFGQPKREPTGRTVQPEYPQPMRMRRRRPVHQKGSSYGSSYDDEYEVETGHPRYDYTGRLRGLGDEVGSRQPRPNGAIRRPPMREFQ